MDVQPDRIPHSELYRILIGAVAPRPIAWVSTLSQDGVPNLAPFSFFNVVCGKPPLVGFSPAVRSPEEQEALGNRLKDTLRNIRETGEFVVNVVTFFLAEAMNMSSGAYEASVSEFEIAKLTTRSSQRVRPPQVADSPVSFECKLFEVLEFGQEPSSGSLVIGEIVSLYLKDEVLVEGKLDPRSLDLIGRMGGIEYTRTTDRFEMPRPKVPARK